MKYSILFLFLLTAFISNAQTLSVLHKNDPAYFLNNVKYDKLPLFDVDKIESMSVVKDQPEQYPNGAIKIKSKSDATFSFLSLEQVAKKYISDATPYMVMVDNEFITDMSGVSIDMSYILKCETLSTKDFKHLQNLPAMIILKITTATKANIENAKKIMIRG
jgi:hypothetical protein